MDGEVSKTEDDSFRSQAAWWCFFGGITLFIYLLRRFLRGRDQVRRNCDLIGKQLEHLQRVIEESERKEKEKEDLAKAGEGEGEIIKDATPETENADKEEKKDK